MFRLPNGRAFWGTRVLALVVTAGFYLGAPGYSLPLALLMAAGYMLIAVVVWFSFKGVSAPATALGIPALDMAWALGWTFLTRIGNPFALSFIILGDALAFGVPIGFAQALASWIGAIYLGIINPDSAGLIMGGMLVAFGLLGAVPGIYLRFRTPLDSGAREGGEAAMRLGELLVRRGFLTRDQLDEAVGAQTAMISEVNLLQDISTRLGKTASLRELLAAIAERGMEILGNDHVFILLEDPNVRAFKVFFQQGLTEREAAEYRLPFDHPLARDTMRDLKPRVWDDVLRQPELKEVLIRPGVRSCAVVPFVFRERMVGFLVATSRYESAFRAEDVNLLGIIGAQVGLYIENARLQDERARIGSMLVDRGIISRQDLDDVLREQSAIRGKLDQIHALQQSVQNLRTILEVVTETGGRLAATLESRALIMLVRGDENFELAHQFGTEQALLQQSIPVEHPIIEHLVKWRSPRSFPAGENPFDDLKVPAGCDWIVIIPVFSRQELTAVAISFTSEPVEPDVIRIAESLAVLGGIGMENIRLEAKTARIGRILVKRGTVREDELERALGVQEEIFTRKELADRCLERIGALESPLEILQLIEDFLSESFDIQRFAVLELEDETYKITRHKGLILPQGESFHVPDNAPAIEVLAHSEAPLAFASLPGSENLKIAPRLLNHTLWFASPFFSRGELAAFLLYRAPGEGFLNPDSTAILYRFTTQCGIFLRNARVVENRNRLGDLLVSGGRITTEQLHEALEDQKKIAEVEAGVFKLPVRLEKSPVAVVSAQSKPQALRQALALLGGIENLVSEGDTVFIKPGLDAPFGPPFSSDTVLIRETARMCKEAGAEKIIVGAAPLGGVSARAVYTTLGIHEAVKDFAGEVVDLREDEWFRIKVPNPLVLKEISICKSLFSADIFITLSPGAGNPLLGVTPALMGLNGILPPRELAAHLRNLGQSSLADKLGDILSVASPDLSIIEVTPYGSEFLYSKGHAVIIAGPDAVAVDGAASHALGFDPRAMTALVQADKRNLGNPFPGGWDLKGFEDPDKLGGLGAMPERRKPVWPEEVMLLHSDQFPCRGCLAALEKFLEPFSIYFFDAVRRLRSLEILSGENPPQPGGPGPMVCFGDCAVYTTQGLGARRSLKGSENFVDVLGCPPMGLAWAPALKKLFDRAEINTDAAWKLMQLLESAGSGWEPSEPVGRYAWDKPFARRFGAVTEKYYGEAG